MGWLVQFCRTSVSWELDPAGTLDGSKANWVRAIPPVHAAVVAAFAAAGVSITPSGSQHGSAQHLYPSHIPNEQALGERAAESGRQ